MECTAKSGGLFEAFILTSACLLRDGGAGEPAADTENIKHLVGNGSYSRIIDELWKQGVEENLVKLCIEEIVIALDRYFEDSFHLMVAHGKLSPYN
ncbi:CMO protein [Corchorus olitorius]|uniref:CMO protein n=1 Tax=Corchorus olitorius TaxID=93759 RepID=A0A1R3IFX3_9ROSI|nr:CMO protein [Corchorus olitorius]